MSNTAQNTAFNWSKPLWILASVAVGYGIYESKKLFRFASDFQLHITKFGLPSMNQGRVYFPVTIEIDNPTPSTLTLDSIFATVSRFDGQEWSILGNSQPDLVGIKIHPLKTTKIQPEISVPLTSLPGAILNFFQQKVTGRAFKLDVKIGLAGSTLTTTEIIQI